MLQANDAADQFMAALCLWREARGEGVDGMTAIMNVLQNRVKRNNSTLYIEVTKPWQFSSITAKGDPQLGLYPHGSDSTMLLATNIVSFAYSGTLKDETAGATLYYDDSIPFPSSWDKTKVEATVKIGRLNFFKEI